MRVRIFTAAICRGTLRIAGEQRLRGAEEELLQWYAGILLYPWIQPDLIYYFLSTFLSFLCIFIHFFSLFSSFFASFSINRAPLSSSTAFFVRERLLFLYIGAIDRGKAFETVSEFSGSPGVDPSIVRADDQGQKFKSSSDLYAQTVLSVTTCLLYQGAYEFGLQFRLV